MKVISISQQNILHIILVFLQKHTSTFLDTEPYKIPTKNRLQNVYLFEIDRPRTLWHGFIAIEEFT
jgi:hypothetical protein